jgi:hypothetical protein
VYGRFGKDVFIVVAGSLPEEMKTENPKKYPVCREKGRAIMKSNKLLITKGFLLLFVISICLASGGNLWADTAATPVATAAAAPSSLQGFMNYADFTWVNGNTKEHDFPLDGKFFSPEFLFDTNYVYNFANPNDHTIAGSTCMANSGEVEVEHIGVGGDFHIPVGTGSEYVRGRIMTEFGMYASQVPRDDETPARGSWNVLTGTQYLTEAYGGYHFDIPGTDGLNIDMGQFPSYVGLFSFYDSENWCYQASYVSSNTPWFFTGMRVQFFPNDTLKIEPWIINGWQTYNEFNNGIGNTGINLGFELRWAPSPDVLVISNNYMGTDEPNSPSCYRYHTDDSFLLKYLDDPKSNGIDKMAFSLTVDYGFMQGPMFIGVGASTANGNPADANGFVQVGPTGPNAEEFLGAMMYDRTWFSHDQWAFTFGGGIMNNPGRYLALLPPINGDTGANYSNDPVANAAFTESPGAQWLCWDYDFGVQWMPNQYLTLDLEYTHRWSSVNYFVGPGGITSSDGWQAGAATGSQQANGGYVPNLVQSEDLIVGALMVHI